MAEDRVQALRSRIACLEEDLAPGSSWPHHQHGEHLRITVARPLEGGKLGILVQDRVVASVSDPRALQHGWCVGDVILQVNGQPVDSMLEFSGALSAAMALYQASGNPLTFEVCRHPDIRAPCNPGIGTVAAVAVPATAIATLPTVLAAPSDPQVIRCATPQVSPAPVALQPLSQARVLGSSISSSPGSAEQSATLPLPSTLPLAVQSVTLPLASALVQAISQQAARPQTTSITVLQQQQQQLSNVQQSQQPILSQMTPIPVQQQQQQQRLSNVQQSHQGPAQQLRTPGCSGSAVLPTPAGQFSPPKVRPKATAKRRIC